MAQEDTFDTSALIETENTGDLNRYMEPVPEGEMMARINADSVKVERFTSKAGNLVTLCRMVFTVEDEDVKAAMKMDKPTINASIFLDMENGRLTTKDDNPNANVALGKLKYALRIPEGKPWSLRQFEGLSCFIKVAHDPNPEDIEHPYSRVTGFYRDRKDAGAAPATNNRRGR
jgi:hypothetical protein